MTITDPSTTEVFIPEARTTLCVVPESFDTAEVDASFIQADSEHPTVVVELHGMKMQTFRCDPVIVAAAMRRLANRIEQAAHEARNVRNSGVTV